MAQSLSPAVRVGLVGIATAMAAVAIAAGIYFASNTSPVKVVAVSTDPRVNYSGPYLNVRPDVAYVGDAVCAGCHDQIHDSYRHHPMGRSLMSLSSASMPPIDVAHHNPVSALDATLRIEKKGDRFWSHVIHGDASGPICESAYEMQYIIGSGNHGQSFLTNRDGYLYQTPISWFSEKKIWDLSPGWAKVDSPRVVRSQCLYCHANHVTPVEGSLNHYAEPIFGSQATIGCERCHGPGALHVDAQSGKTRGATGQDFTIVNPKHLSPELREAVCQQCHLEGAERFVRRGRNEFDFRPGLPLEAFFAVFVQDGPNYNAVNHVEQMYQSRCFEKSEGQLGCISCHDPHHKPTAAERVPHYRKQCMTCHESHGCTVPVAKRRETTPADSCIDCHMVRNSTADIVHAASADHRILRKPARDVKAVRGATIRPFFGKPENRTFEDERDLAIALVQMVSSNRLPGSAAAPAEDWLRVALERHPEDVDALEAKAILSISSHLVQEGGAALGKALEYAPNRETLLVRAATMAQHSNQLETAIDLWQQAIAINPWEAQYHGDLARCLVLQSNWGAARAPADRWYALEPSNVDARRLRIELLLHEGKTREATSELALIERLKPKEIDLWRKWFDDRQKK